MKQLTLIEKQILSTDGTRIQAYTYGDNTKPAVVFVHGYPDNHAIWQPMMTHFADDYFIITYDVRGCGQSDKPDGTKHYRLGQLADDLWAVTTDIIGNKPFHAIAHDWGSIQTWESACQVRFMGKMLSFISMSGPCLRHASATFKNDAIPLKTRLKQLASSWYIGMLHLPVLPKLFWKRQAPMWHKLQKMPINPTQYKDAVFGRYLYQANMLTKPTIHYKKHPKAICPVYLPMFTKDEFVSNMFYVGMETWVDDLTREALPLKHWSIYHDADLLADKIKGYLARFH